MDQRLKKRSAVWTHSSSQGHTSLLLCLCGGLAVVMSEGPAWGSVTSLTSRSGTALIQLVGASDHLRPDFLGGWQGSRLTFIDNLFVRFQKITAWL
uniref:Uncharacterized protein n=1 Tax=Timema cristinae TaxID=61476 RepID=A0A7R9DFP0_TIMCR|nr:unnamed protein product [Timema cristinae]